MTLVYISEPVEAPQTHVLMIGVNDYPHLVDGRAEWARQTLGLGQLNSPVISLSALLDWLLNVGGYAGRGFLNPECGLGSIEVLASCTPQLTFFGGGTQVQVDVATKQNIEVAFDGWLKRTKSHPDNAGIFYFCGHGLLAGKSYLLAGDFGDNPNRPWDKAINITDTVLAVGQQIQGSTLFLLDACRATSKEIILSSGGEPSALLVAQAGQRFIRRSNTTIFSTGIGELAFALNGKVSRFTEALLESLTKYCGIKRAGKLLWDIDGEVLASAVRQILESGNQTAQRKQVSDQHVQGDSVPFFKRQFPPLVKVHVDVEPVSRRQVSNLHVRPYLQDAAKGYVTHVHSGSQGALKKDMPRGQYAVGATNNVDWSVEHPNEELVPPIYNLMLP